MTKPHSKFVKAVGNGNQLVTTVIRIATSVLGVVLAAGMIAMVTHQWDSAKAQARIAAEMSAIANSVNGMIINQTRIDNRQEQRLDRHGARLQFLERQRGGGLR